MTEKLQQRVELLAKNRQILRESFGAGDSALYPMAALLCTSDGVLADPEKIRLAQSVIREKEHAFSAFRGVSGFPIAVLLSRGEDIPQRFERMRRAYSMIRKYFTASDYLPISAATIEGSIPEEEYPACVAKMHRVYDHMKKEHRFLTSSEDSTYAALFALSPLEPEAAILEMEACYDRLRSRFAAGNALQALSHALTFGAAPVEEKCSRVIRLYELFKEKKHRFGKLSELAVLGVLAQCEGEEEQIVEDVISISRALEAEKGFSPRYMMEKQRLMYAAILASQEYESLSPVETVAVNSVTGMVIAQQAGMLACVTAMFSAASISRAGN